MEIHPIVLVGTVVIPLSIITGIMVWVAIVRNRNLKREQDEKIKARQAAKENELFESLVSYKNKHIDLLQKKLKA